MSQNDMIIKDLEDGVRLTQLDAYQRYGCTRLAARVEELRKQGNSIVTKYITRNKKTFAQYYLNGRGTG